MKTSDATTRWRQGGLQLEFEIHPAAMIFPPLSGAEFERLKADIARNGLQLAIQVWEGKILDGRNRALACAQLGITPRYETMTSLPTESPLHYVLAVNLHRRHLNATQRALVAAKSREYFDASARARQGHSQLPENLPEAYGDARDRAGAATGVSGKSVDHATRVLNHGAPELVEACARGELAISAAAKLVRLPQAEQCAVLKGGKRCISTALRALRSSDSHAASDELGRLIAQAFRLESSIRRRYGSLTSLFDADDFDRRLLFNHVQQLNALTKALAALSAEATAYAHAVRNQTHGQSREHNMGRPIADQ